MSQDIIPISVVMPVYNTPVSILTEAVESILEQTFTEFEFIIINDGSNQKDTLEYLASLDDKRIRIINNSENIGITKSLNLGLRASRGKYIARMDSDDIALPRRFEVQYAFMESHPEVLISGSKVECFGDKKAIWGWFPNDQELYRIWLLFFNIGPIHSSAMFNREKMLQHDLWYDERFKYSQDYMMWINASQVGIISCIYEILMMYRLHSGQISSNKAAEQHSYSIQLRERQLNELLGMVTRQEAENHINYYFNNLITDDAYKWFMKLVSANNKNAIYNKKKFRAFITDLVERKIYATYDIDWKALRSYRILFKYLPASYVLNQVKKKAAKKINKLI